MILLLLSILHALALIGLAILGLHRSHLLYVFERHKGHFSNKAPPTCVPILIQIPVYNEANVIERCLEAVGKLTWHSTVHIQILDDSIDETSNLIERFIRSYDGPHRVSHLQRTDRIGYKAGALAEGLTHSTETWIAIFDADFTPAPEFLLKLTAHLVDDAIGMVQGRWDHLNRNESLLTEAAAVVLDGHFVIEHSGRHLQRCFFNFNGTAGVWKRACIEDAGGWHWDTITEDLDLSYRAQLNGWRFVYTPLVSAKAEIPNSMTALMAQQFRWAKGTTQTARKILPKLWKRQESFSIKREGTAHFCANLGYWMTVLLSIVLPFTHRLRWDFQSLWGVLDLLVFASSFLALLLFHQRAQTFLNQWRLTSWRHWRAVTTALVIGVGLAPSQSIAVCQGLWGTDTTFERTPKDGSSKQRTYRVHQSIQTRLTQWITVALGLYSTVGLIYTIQAHNWPSVPFQFIFSVGYLWVGVASLREP